MNRSERCLCPWKYVVEISVWMLLIPVYKLSISCAIFMLTSSYRALLCVINIKLFLPFSSGKYYVDTLFHTYQTANVFIIFETIYIVSLQSDTFPVACSGGSGKMKRETMLVYSFWYLS